MAKLWCDSPIIKRAHETGHVQARDQIMWCISVDVVVCQLMLWGDHFVNLKENIFLIQYGARQNHATLAFTFIYIWPHLSDFVFAVYWMGVDTAAFIF